jgi:FKBP-type peptidyl-prolyl cis-trans isomerase SlyD
MTIQNNKVVTMHYHLTNTEDQVLDSSRGSTPLTYLHGAGNIIPGLENELTGLDVGATKIVEVAPADAYGEHDASKVQTLPRGAFDRVQNLQVGMPLQMRDPHGQTVSIRVMDIRHDTVVIDANHPLAGQTLTFAIEVLAIRDATAEELTHGHVHEEGEHDH